MKMAMRKKSSAALLTVSISTGIVVKPVSTLPNTMAMSGNSAPLAPAATTPTLSSSLSIGVAKRYRCVNLNDVGPPCTICLRRLGSFLSEPLPDSLLVSGFLFLGGTSTASERGVSTRWYASPLASSALSRLGIACVGGGNLGNER